MQCVLEIVAYVPRARFYNPPIGMSRYPSLCGTSTVYPGGVLCLQPVQHSNTGKYKHLIFCRHLIYFLSVI